MKKILILILGISIVIIGVIVMLNKKDAGYMELPFDSSDVSEVSLKVDTTGDNYSTSSTTNKDEIISIFKNSYYVDKIPIKKNEIGKKGIKYQFAFTLNDETTFRIQYDSIENEFVTKDNHFILKDNMEDWIEEWMSKLDNQEE